MYIRKFEKKQAKVACSPRDWTLKNHCHSHHHDYYHQNHHHYHCHHHHHHQYQCRTSQITKQMCSCDLILNLTEPFDVTHRFSSVQSLSRILLWPRGPQHARIPCPSPTPRAHSNSCSLSWWCHPTISSSVESFSSCLQSFPASESFPGSQFFVTGGHRIGVSALASVPPMNIQDWSLLGWTGLMSLQFKWLSRLFSNTTVQKHQFFGAQLSL